MFDDAFMDSLNMFDDAFMDSLNMFDDASNLCLKHLDR